MDGKQLVSFLVCVILATISLGGCIDSKDTNSENGLVEDSMDPREVLSSVLGGILLSGIDAESISSIIDAVNHMIEGQKEEALVSLQFLSSVFSEINLTEVVVGPAEVESDLNSGLYFGDIRDARVSLANVDKIKADGFNTVLLEAQMLADENGTLYIPGEEVYFFYINAFRASGFRVWLAVGPTAYEFPYRFDSPTHCAIPLENQLDVFNLTEPLILEWAEIAKEFQIDTFIPLEETNALVIDYGDQRRRLYDDERIFLSTWGQEIVAKVNNIFSGNIAFSIEDWGPLDPEFDESQGYPISEIGPDFDYRGYDFVAVKGTYLNGLPQEHWYLEMTSRLSNAKKYAERDGVGGGVIWYEAGTPMDKGLDPNLGAHLTALSDEEQAENFRDIFEIVETQNLSGVFFKPSPLQPHEGSWSFFDKPAEQVLRDNLADKGVIGSKTIDNLWVALGEEGLKAIQLAIAPDVPFDPDYSLDWSYFNETYHALEETIDGGHYGYSY